MFPIADHWPTLYDPFMTSFVSSAHPNEKERLGKKGASHEKGFERKK
jgi:hypothetical protein